MCSSPVPQSRAVLQRRVEFLPGGLQHGARLEVVLAFERLGHAVVDVPPPAAQSSASVPISSMQPCWNDLLGSGISSSGSKRVDLAQPVALQAHALRAVEAEQLRAGRLEARCRNACRRSRPRSTMSPRPAPCVSRGVAPRSLGVRPSAASLLGATIRLPSPSLQRQLDRLGQPRADLAGSTASRSTTTSMSCRICRSSCRSSVSRTTLAVDPGADEPLLQQVLEQVAILALLAADQRGQHDELRARRQRQDPLRGSARGSGP